MDKAGRYARTDEWLDVVRRTWLGGEPFDYTGQFYDVVGQKSAVLPFNDSGIRVFFGGSSEDAYRVGGKHADVFALWGEPLAETAEQIASVRSAAKLAGRSEMPGISVSFRPILGPTEDEAWERAHQILATAKENVATRGPLKEKKEGVGTKRLLEAAEKGERHDRALWTPIAEAVGAYGNTTALVGTPETVAQALLDYVEIGVTTLLLRGFDPLDDAVDYGRELIPLVRAAVANREPVAAASA